MDVRPIPPRDMNFALTALGPFVPELNCANLVEALRRYEANPLSPGRPSVGRLLRKTEACRILSVSLATLDRMVRDGQLPRVQVRGGVRIPADAVAKLVEG
jgi:excisionase family DNA binding protein